MARVRSASAASNSLPVNRPHRSRTMTKEESETLMMTPVFSVEEQKTLRRCSSTNIVDQKKPAASSSWWNPFGNTGAAGADKPQHANTANDLRKQRSTEITRLRTAIYALQEKNQLTAADERLLMKLRLQLKNMTQSS